MATGDIRDTLMALPHTSSAGTDHYVTQDLFPVRHDLIREMVNLRSVFEFGALVGYFLVTALDAAPSIARAGWVDNESHTAGSNALCAANILSEMEEAGRSVELWWSRSDSAGFGSADLVHIDGDHSFAGCFTDLVRAAELGPRWIMVDDYAAIPTVRDATRAFARWQRVGLEEHPTVNGLAVLRMRH